MKTRVVNLRLDEPFDVRIDRRSPWGNPYRMARESDRSVVVECFERWVASDDPKAVWIREHVRELRGKRLACWCAPAGGVTAADRPWCCHGQILAQMADQDLVSIEDRVLALLEQEPMDAAGIVATTGLTEDQVGTALTFLELRGRVREVAGLFYLLRRKA